MHSSPGKRKAKKILKNPVIQASLCPSSNCTGDPEDCRLEPLMEQGVEAPLRCDACVDSSAVGWCRPECPVDDNEECCYNPHCYNCNKDACWWRDYMTSEFCWFIWFQINVAQGRVCDLPGSIPHGNWSCQVDDVNLPGFNFMDSNANEYQSEWRSPF